MIVRAGNHAHYAIIAFHRHGAAIGLKREKASLDIMPGLARFIGRKANGHDFRVGKADSGDAPLVPGMFTARNYFGHHFSLRHGAVR
ncbi:Uncharacterised protein [Brucella suis]|nr:Uncharacterised protein [Brucella suis]